MPRIILIVAALALLYYLFQRLSSGSGFKTCGRCDGKGYWDGTGEKVTCDWCKGSGKLAKK